MQLQEIPLENMEIHPSKVQWTKASHVQSLSESIYQQGLLNPLVVVKKDKTYQVLSGAHRMQALKKLQMKTAPCVLLFDDADSEILMNILHLDGKQRTTNALQEGQLLYQLLNLGNSQVELSELVDRSPSWIQHRLALVVSLAPEVQDMVARNFLSARKAQSIARLPLEKQESFAWKVKKERLSVNEVDQLVAVFNGKKTDDELKDCILNTPRLALQATKKNPVKGVASDIRNICFSMVEMQKNLENIKELLAHRKEIKAVERRELKKSLQETKQLLEAIGSLIGKTRKRGSKEVPADHSDSDQEQDCR